MFHFFGKSRRKAKNDFSEPFVICISLVVFVCLHMSYAQVKTGTDGQDAQKFDIRKVQISVPASVQKELLRRITDLAAAVYPEADQSKIRQEFTKSCMKNEFIVNALPTVQGPYTNVRAKAVNLGCTVSFPVGDHFIAIGAGDWPPGSTTTKPDKPLELEDAKAVALSLLSRLVTSEPQRARMKLCDADYVSHEEEYYFRWVEVRDKPSRGGGIGIMAFIRKTDGLIKNVHIILPLEDPKIPADKIIEEAKKSIPEFDDDYIELSSYYWCGERRLVWRYQVPPPPDRLPWDCTMWDAETGKLLYSEVLNGGKPGKPYRCPEFFCEPTKEAVTARLNKLVKKQAAELESAKKQEDSRKSDSDTTKPTTADTKPE